MRVAVIDCGTNTVRLLIADGDPGCGLTEVARDLRFARLGQGVDASGSFSRDALTRTFSVVSEYAQIIAESEVDKVRFVATSAARDAGNREEFFEGVRRYLGVTPDVISGEEEAELSFLGALSGGPVVGETSLVIDIGGGSTELIRGTVQGQIESAVSLDMGSVRLRERYLMGDPPGIDHIEAARSFVSNLLDGAISLDEIDIFIGVAGTLTSLSAMYQGLEEYDRAKVHNSTLDVETITDLSAHLLGLTVSEIVAAYPSLPPQRAEVIGAGGLIAAEIAERVGRPMIVRETDILDGAAMKLLASE